MPLSVIQSTGFGTFYSRINRRKGLPDPVADILKPYLRDNYTTQDKNRGATNDPVAIDRSVCMDELIQKEIEGGKIKTIFNAGCGFCTRYWRLGIDKLDIEWVECDYTNVLRCKLDAYRGCNIKIPKNYIFMSSDLQKSCIPVGFDLCIAEGLFVWLEKSFVINNIHQKTIFDVIGIKRTTVIGKEQKWLFDENEDVWSNVNFDLIQRVGPESREHRVIIATPK